MFTGSFDDTFSDGRVDIKWYFDRRVDHVWNLDENDSNKYTIQSYEVERFVSQMLSNSLEDINLAIAILNNCNVNIYYNYVYNLLRKSEIWKLDWRIIDNKDYCLKRRFYYD